jgi:hypothetical protein
VLAQVGRLTHLKQLHRPGVAGTDSGLVHLSRLSDLQLLSLDDTQATDAGLDQLKGAQGPQMAQTHKNQDHRRGRGCASEVVAGFEAYALIESAIMMEMG